MSDSRIVPPIDSFSEENREFVAVLRGTDDELRMEEIDSLGEVDDEVADELLRMLDSDAPDDLRAAVAIALGPSLELCDNELDDEGRLATGGFSIAPLSQAAYERVAQGLRRWCEDPSAPALVRRRALEAAVRSPQDWQEGVVRSAWVGGDPDWRLTAVFCMGYFYRGEFEAEIGEAFRSASEDLRREAILAAGRRGLDELLPEVTRIARDENAPVELRYAAVEALGDLGGEDEVELLEELVESPDETLSEIAAEALDGVQINLELERMDDDLDEADDDDPR